ncbi:MAG: hypothetical protein QM724_13075 [Flavobacteriales bacterium]
MHIRVQLLKEHSRANAEHIARYVGDDAKRFAELMHCMLHDDTYRVCQRASYSVGLACEAHPHLAAPYLKDLLAVLDQPVHEAVQRNSLRIMQYCELPAWLHGAITQAAFARVADPSRSIAQRAFAIRVAERMVEAHPELGPELRMLLENVLREHPTPAVRSRATKVLQALPGRSSR